MTKKISREEKLLAIKEQDIDANKLLAELSLTPNADKVNTNRGVLWCNHLAQIPVLKNDNPETPLLYSGLENEVGKYSSGYKKIKEPFKVIKKFYRNKYDYQLLVRYKYSKMYDILYRSESHWLSEKYGYHWNNYMDSLEAGDKVDEKDTVIRANTSYDDQMNLCYGHNIRAIYYADSDLTHEDSVTLAKSATELFSHNNVIPVTVNLNTNNILLNLYGDEESYKCFPDVGEEIEHGQLLMRRIINYDKILTDLRDLRHYREGDDVIYLNGKVVDIQVYCNNDIENLKDISYYKQILGYINKERAYAEYVTNFLEPILDKEKEYCSDEVILFHNKLKKSIDKNKFTLNDNQFDNIVIKFLIEKETKVKIGDKFTGRYGL